MQVNKKCFCGFPGRQIENRLVLHLRNVNVRELSQLISDVDM